MIKKPALGASGLGKPKPKEKAKEGGRPAKKVGIVRRFFDANSDAESSSDDDGEGGNDESQSDDDEEVGPLQSLLATSAFLRVIGFLVPERTRSCKCSLVLTICHVFTQGTKAQHACR